MFPLCIRLSLHKVVVSMHIFNNLLLSFLFPRSDSLFPLLFLSSVALCVFQKQRHGHWVEGVDETTAAAAQRRDFL